MLYLSATLTDTDPAAAADLVAREIGHRALGHRGQSAAGTCLWVTLGFALSAVLFPDHGVAGTLLATAAVMSTWCWLGLFVWPALGRHQILAADRFAARTSPTGGRAMLDALTEHNLPDEHLPPAVAYVFHPIPPMAARRSALELT